MSHYLCKIAEIGENGKEISVRGDAETTYIMLFLHVGVIRAFLNTCPHHGLALSLAPDLFFFSPERLLVCPHHGASFELDTGQCLEGPCRGASLRAVKIRLDEEFVWLDQELA